MILWTFNSYGSEDWFEKKFEMNSIKGKFPLSLDHIGLHPPPGVGMGEVWWEEVPETERMHKFGAKGKGAMHKF